MSEQVKVERLVEGGGGALRKAQAAQVEVARTPQVAHALGVLALHVHQEALERTGQLAALPVADAVDHRQRARAVTLECKADGAGVLDGAGVDLVGGDGCELVEPRAHVVDQAGAHLRPDDAPDQQGVCHVCARGLAEEERSRFPERWLDVDARRALDRAQQVERVASHHEVLGLQTLTAQLAVGDACLEGEAGKLAGVERQQALVEKMPERGRDKVGTLRGVTLAEEVVAGEARKDDLAVLCTRHRRTDARVEDVEQRHLDEELLGAAVERVHGVGREEALAVARQRLAHLSGALCATLREQAELVAQRPRAKVLVELLESLVGQPIDKPASIALHSVLIHDQIVNAHFHDVAVEQQVVDLPAEASRREHHMETVRRIAVDEEDHVVDCRAARHSVAVEEEVELRAVAQQLLKQVEHVDEGILVGAVDNGLGELRKAAVNSAEAVGELSSEASRVAISLVKGHPQARAAFRLPNQSVHLGEKRGFAVAGRCVHQTDTPLAGEYECAPQAPRQFITRRGNGAIELSPQDSTGNGNTLAAQINLQAPTHGALPPLQRT